MQEKYIPSSDKDYSCQSKEITEKNGSRNLYPLYALLVQMDKQRNSTFYFELLIHHITN